MLSLLPRGGAGASFSPAARAFFLCVMLTTGLVAAPSSPGGKMPAGTSGSGANAGGTPALPGADPEAVLQRLSGEVERIDPSSPDAAARLRNILRELIQVERARQREVAVLRAELAALRGSGGARGTGIARRRASVPVAGAAAPGLATTAAAGGSVTGGPAPAGGALFGKRGLKKVHRPGCTFGERIPLENRVYFKDLQEAAAAGYEPCKVCRPGE